MDVDTYAELDLVSKATRVFGQKITNIERVQRCAPQANEKPFQRNHSGEREENEEEEAHSFVSPCQSCPLEEKEITSLPEWDQSDKEIDIECVPYMSDIMDALREMERKTQKERSIDFLRHQSTLNANMRARLVEWLLDVHWKYNFSPCVWHAAIAILDRYMRREPIDRQSFQLFGLTSLWIAIKYHETFTLTTADLREIYEREKEDYIETEKRIVTALKFELSIVTPFMFAQRFIKIAQFCLPKSGAKFAEHFTTYLLDLAFLHYPLSLEQPSKIAAASVTFVLLVSQKTWNEKFVDEFGYTLQDLNPLLTTFEHLVNNPTLYETVRRKYSKKRFSKVEKVLDEIGIVNIERLIAEAKKLLLRNSLTISG